MSILAIVVENMKSLKKMLMKIFSVSMVMHILQENIKCAHGLMGKVGWIINLGTASFGNESLFTQQKENSPLKSFLANVYGF